MCGLTGFISIASTQGRSALVATVERMALRLQHRGPDDGGTWVDEQNGIALAHRRLSVIDLSPCGNQPMVSASGRYVFAFNGEIYNFQALRHTIEEYAPTQWRGHSDTEVMLAAIDLWGVRKAIEESVGMFAFALWDREQQYLHLCRDRLGEKPLYFGWSNSTLLFGSELKALGAHPAWQGEIDRDALTLLLRSGYIPAPYSIYKGIRKLLPGSLLRIDAKHLQPGFLPEAEHYWSVDRAMNEGHQQPFSGTACDAVAELDLLLRQAIQGQMIADVPLGAFLSGGVDSSTVVALMQEVAQRPVKTFTIGFGEEEFNEADQAKAVARHLGTEHTELYVTPQQALDIVPQLPHLYDEPFSDASQIPTLLVSQLARTQVKVCLSGDGGDELFGGYNRYLLAGRLSRTLSAVPHCFRHAVARLLTEISPEGWNALFFHLSFAIPSRWRHGNLGDKLHKLAQVLTMRSPNEIFRQLVSHWQHPERIVIDSQEPQTMLSKRMDEADTSYDFEQQMMHMDMLSYLPDDILAKVDRAAMGVSLETRIPFLDHRVVEFSSRLPLSLKIHNGQGKWILRQVLYKYVPRSLINRPKMGFGVPIDSWLRGPLRDWAEDLLSEERIRRDDFFDPVPIREKWLEHLSGKRNWQYQLWDVLMFQEWKGSLS